MKPEYPSAGRANYTLAVLVLAYIISFIDRQILSLLVGPIRHDLAISDFQMSLLQGMAFALFYVILGLPIGRMADTHNRKTIITVGIMLWSLMTAACGLAKSFGMLFLARMGVGVGEATLSPSAYSILSDSFPPDRLPRATGIYTMGITLGSGIAYIIGGSVVGLVSTTESVELPLFGALRSWQAAFILVGLPGLLVGLLAMTITEPTRQGVIRAAGSDAAADVTAMDVFRFMKQRWRSYGAVFASISTLSILGYGYLNWYPAFLMRTYGMTVGEVGIGFGFVYLIFGSAGAYGGSMISEFLKRRGYADANPRTVVIVALALVPLAAGPLMPNATLALIVAAPTVFFLNAFFGVSIAALQIVTPNQMRALMSAMFLLATTFVGLGLGASIVAFFTDFVFGNDLALRYSLAVVSIITCPVAALIMSLGLSAYRRALHEAEAWNKT